MNAQLKVQNTRSTSAPESGRPARNSSSRPAPIPAAVEDARSSVDDIGAAAFALASPDEPTAPTIEEIDDTTHLILFEERAWGLRMDSIDDPATMREHAAVLITALHGTIRAARRHLDLEKDFSEEPDTRGALVLAEFASAVAIAMVKQAEAVEEYGRSHPDRDRFYSPRVKP